MILLVSYCMCTWYLNIQRAGSVYIVWYFQWSYFYLTAFSWRRWWHPTPVLLPGKSHGRRSPVGYSPWGRWGSDTTERLYFHFSLSCIGEGKGNPLQCSCLENPRDGGAWRAAVYGVAQSWTQLKRLSSSSSSRTFPTVQELLWYYCSPVCGLPSSRYEIWF